MDKDLVTFLDSLLQSEKFHALSSPFLLYSPPSLLSRTVVSSAATQQIWILHVFEAIHLKSLHLRSCRECVDILVRFDLLGERYNTSETNAGSFEGNHEYHFFYGGCRLGVED